MKKNKAIKIKLKSYDAKLIDDAAKKLTKVAIASGAQMYGPVPLPTRRERFTVLRSTHVNKASRQQYELRTHKRLLGLTKVEPDTLDKLSRVILPSGVSIEISTK